jgi:hypothetical protein
MGTGGMRTGAGRPGWKRKAEQSLAFDVRQVARKGMLRPGAFAWHWTSNYGEKVGSVGVRVTDDAQRMIRINRTPCNYGGSRPWLLCPSCGRRCAVVYFGAPGGRYACRRCSRVAYLSQCEDETGRLWRKQRKIECKLAGGASEWNGWQKPKGMHQQTFDRLRHRIGEIEMRKDDLFAFLAASLFRRIGVQF